MSGAEETDALLSRLFAVHAEPVINGIIRYKLRHNLNRSGADADAEDLRQEAIAQLLVELQKPRSNMETHPIRDVRGLAATITYRLCARWMRRQFPRKNYRGISWGMDAPGRSFGFSYNYRF
jgi:DNA-directed RNA polymerase specialized sigma24 family protein